MIQENPTTSTIYLASNSPRRQELLKQIGIEFEQLSVHIDESQLANEPPEVYVRRMALEKAAAGLELAQHSKPVLAADTTVVSGGRCFGKPRDQAHAATMLKQLSGTSHQVITTVAVFYDNERHWLSSSTDITFRPINETEIHHYWLTGEPCDKAGAYAIQGKGALFVSKMIGSYSGVVGLPLHETEQLLNKVGISCWTN